MDERTRELIAIGVSVGAHCQPCLEFHLGKARELGIADEDIREAVKIGHMVESGASRAMQEFVGQVLDQAQGGGCCSGGKSDCCA